LAAGAGADAAALGSTFLGVGFSDFGAGGQLPFLSLVTQFTSVFAAGLASTFAGSAANATDETARAINAINVFILKILKKF